ncbi:response regulator [Paracidovorax wautersii]|uniref:DNA-binding response regulator, NarL/FixJ family, contains REC and HTH domains n=1 Tax=Paracidovorax wautersii TaxID=1177982 RepID=A0A1I2BLX9_9BURK|nr:response regulator transcription factor [Paracidovorax wautersii]SFE56927.1 DNA-binding response regulator, NarL/FixJ family, contains REC and HTH domains [Paracidovorax wautersii]
MSEPETCPPRPLRLLIVDDQPLIRRALAMTLGVEPDIEVVGQAVDGQDAIDQALALQPDMVVMDLQMPRVSGVVATREITARLPAARVVVLTTFDHDDLVFEAIRAGARAYLLKDAAEDEVLETIRAVQRGESRLSPQIACKVLEEFRRLGTGSPPAAPVPEPGPGALPTPPAPGQPLQEPLTDKEARILELIADGLSNKKIAASVFLAEGTVKNYVSRIMEKLHARNRTELAVMAAARRS